MLVYQRVTFGSASFGTLARWLKTAGEKHGELHHFRGFFIPLKMLEQSAMAGSVLATASLPRFRAAHWGEGLGGWDVHPKHHHAPSAWWHSTMMTMVEPLSLQDLRLQDLCSKNDKNGGQVWDLWHLEWQLMELFEESSQNWNKHFVFIEKWTWLACFPNA